MRSASTGFFRDVTMPSRSADHAAHERFLLDTYAERKAVERPPRRYLRTVMARAAAAFR